MTRIELDKNQRGIILTSHKSPMTPASLRHDYDHAVRIMNELQVQPTRLGGTIPGIGSKFLSYKSRRSRVESSDFSKISNIELCHLKPERNVHDGTDCFNWTAYAHVGLEDGLHPEVKLMSSYITVFYEDAGVSQDNARDQLLAYGHRVIKTYGYMVLLTRQYSLFPLFNPPSEGRGMWLDYFADHCHMSILRDVYPWNFLSRSYLDIPIEGTTLEKWIMKSDDRGRLEKFNDHVVLWEPPREEIPTLRERLFRAGILLYYYFFHPASRHYRDWSKPFVPSEPIPDTFRAETYAGTDPRVMG